MKKRILTFVLAIVTTLSLVACGGNSTEKGTENTNAGNAETEQVEDDGTTYFREFFTTEKNRICYMIEDEGGKNSVIIQAYVFQDGKAWVYPLQYMKIKITMGEVAQMTDDEILDLFDAKLQETLNKEIDACNQILAKDIYNDFSTGDKNYTGMSVVKDGITEYKQILENFDARKVFAMNDIVYEVYTDDTGNNVDYEIVRWNQNSCAASNIGFIQYVLNNYQDDGGVQQYLVDAWQDGHVKITEEGDHSGNIIDYDVVFEMEPQENAWKVNYAYRSALYSGGQQIYDSFYGGYYIGKYSLISRDKATDASSGDLYEVDTKAMADFVDPK